MTTTPSTRDARAAAKPALLLRFQSLFDDGRGLAFPCARDGSVDVDALSERARANYLAARARVGREYRWPVVCAG